MTGRKEKDTAEKIKVEKGLFYVIDSKIQWTGHVKLA
jgi:hypothetical protein